LWQPGNRCESVPHERNLDVLGKDERLFYHFALFKRREKERLPQNTYYCMGGKGREIDGPIGYRWTGAKGHSSKEKDEGIIGKKNGIMVAGYAASRSDSIEPAEVAP